MKSGDNVINVRNVTINVTNVRLKIQWITFNGN